MQNPVPAGLPIPASTPVQENGKKMPGPGGRQMKKEDDGSGKNSPNPNNGQKQAPTPTPSTPQQFNVSPQSILAKQHGGTPPTNPMQRPPQPQTYAPQQFSYQPDQFGMMKSEPPPTLFKNEDLIFGPPGVGGPPVDMSTLPFEDFFNTEIFGGFAPAGTEDDGSSAPGAPPMA